MFREDHQDEPGIGDQVEDWGPRVSGGTKGPGRIGLGASQDDQGGDGKGVEEAGCKHDAVGQQIEDGTFAEIVRRLDQGGRAEDHQASQGSLGQDRDHRCLVAGV